MHGNIATLLLPFLFNSFNLNTDFFLEYFILLNNLAVRSILCDDYFKKQFINYWIRYH